ncbi:hypothetical protein CMV_018154 [Castanea mollissima]|uniref:Disease resistance N-terminal domain-containing protein n=1 Tax=Castanea mollissima TaxID=60419 RepID=A0A8J4QNY7_9ROSI|nr:hypothetical protein CMV_018154 [Castanea mollissima]
MAETIVSSLIDRLVPLLTQEAKLLRGIHGEVADIKDELESIQSFLKDADARAAAEEDMSEGVKTWVAQHGPHRRGFTAISMLPLRKVNNQVLLTDANPNPYGIVGLCLRSSNLDGG